eukprot:TRINITY_DN18631_c0_g1_i1.p1 TRINITY_DN18631_c0_g1~~TRINITY_DN18631_c0_g1_i1.p1  ORF type:complete len:111 (+),score=2.61 TRINITY_DN18631_c0_g1_i1:85-417(+)
MVDLLFMAMFLKINLFFMAMFLLLFFVKQIRFWLNFLAQMADLLSVLLRWWIFHLFSEGGSSRGAEVEGARHALLGKLISSLLLNSQALAFSSSLIGQSNHLSQSFSLNF